jgi:glutamate-1-semialdehyde 2,1-aminomutase
VSRSAEYFRPYPVYLRRAKGAVVWDVDGNEYVDLVMGGGPNILGHRNPAVLGAVRSQIENMVQSLAPSELAAQLAARLQQHMSHMQRVRFTVTGSEAVRTALRVARAATGRTMIAKFEGHYHGSDDAVLWSANAVSLEGVPESPIPVADSAGTVPSLPNDVLVLPFNDSVATKALLSEYGPQLAAVVMEPVGFSSGGGVPASPDLAQMVREETARNGSLLIFDEVATGLRLGLAGAAAYLGVTPDLTCIGKGISGGFPIGAVGGRADLMDAWLDPARAADPQVFQSGTFAANPVSLSAGLAIIAVLETEPVLERINKLAATLRDGLEELFSTYGIQASTVGRGSIFQVHFSASPPQNRREILAADRQLLHLFYLGHLARGVYWPPVHSAALSYAHDPGHVDQVLSVSSEVVRSMA